MKNAPNETKYAVQIFGGTPEVMYDAACLVLEQTQASCIDINAGCPVPKVVKTGAGSALTKNPEQLEKIISAVVKAVHHFSEHESISQPFLIRYEHYSTICTEKKA